jgi:N-acetylglucosaminyl-diphospho-decaprenol L-rhamnosyltransferase
VHGSAAAFRPSVAAPELSVVLVTYDSDDVLPRCLAALAAQRGVTLEVIVVDNGSAILPERAEPISQLILNPHNPGFAVACNQGAAHARAPWLLFLNPDCFPGADDLRHLLDLASAQAGLGVLGAQLLEADGRPQPASRRQDPTPVRLLQALRRGRTAIEPATDTDSTTCPIEFAEAVSGALMLMPRAAFDAVRGFDECYRLHFEDLDLCRRLRAGGWRVALAPQVRITHLKGTSSRRRPLWVAWQKHRGLRRYFECFDAAHLPQPRRQLFRLLLWCALPLMLLTALRPTTAPHNEPRP